jgi:hypothetical protein
VLALCAYKSKSIALAGFKLIYHFFRTCGITIYRQTTLPHLIFTDMTYSGVVATVFSGIEPTVALILACVPFLRPLFGKSSNESPASQYNLSDGTHGGYSKKVTGSSQNRTFEELDDDSSEIQLQPVPADSKFYVSASPDHTNSAYDHKLTSKSITIQTKWEVDYNEQERKRNQA